MFWPLAKAANADSDQHMRREYDDYHSREYDAPVRHEYNGRQDHWPECWGTCYAGKCVLPAAQKEQPGCCHVSRKAANSYNDGADGLDEGAVTAEGVQAGKMGARNDLYCWKAV